MFSSTSELIMCSIQIVMNTDSNLLTVDGQHEELYPDSLDRDVKSNFFVSPSILETENCQEKIHKLRQNSNRIYPQFHHDALYFFLLTGVILY